jgi:ABC-type uncharacterized transport system ATPase subunit
MMYDNNKRRSKMDDKTKAMMKLAIQVLDSQDGIDVDAYEVLKELVLEKAAKGEAAVTSTVCFDAVEDLIKNLTFSQGKVFLNEDWAEKNVPKYFN